MDVKKEEKNQGYEGTQKDFYHLFCQAETWKGKKIYIYISL